MNFVIDAACLSNMGKVRSNNEDNFLFDDHVMPEAHFSQEDAFVIQGHREENVCLAVFDGMGGGDYGEAASFLAAEKLHQLLGANVTPDDPESFLNAASEQINQAVYNESIKRKCYQMGTTQAVLYFHNNDVYACNVGDSRIFGSRSGKLLQISCDHTEEAYMAEHGITGRKPRLTQYLGMDPSSIMIEPFTVRGVVQQGDVYLICSDGLTDMVNEVRIAEILNRGDMAADCVKALVDEALKNGGRDNITVVVCRILEQINMVKEEENVADTAKSSVERLGSDKPSWWRKLRSRLRDSEKNIWKR